MAKILELSKTRTAKREPVYKDTENACLCNYYLRNYYTPARDGGIITDTIKANVRGNVVKGDIIELDNGDLYEIKMITVSQFYNKIAEGIRI